MSKSWLSGTYCHKTGTRPPSCITPQEPTIYVTSFSVSHTRGTVSIGLKNLISRLDLNSWHVVSFLYTWETRPVHYQISGNWRSSLMRQLKHLNPKLDPFHDIYSLKYYYSLFDPGFSYLLDSPTILGPALIIDTPNYTACNDACSVS